MRLILALNLITSLALTACAGGGGAGGSSTRGNQTGSEPVNPQEELDYKRAINKCYKTGGSRVVKIEGRLTCY